MVEIGGSINIIEIECKYFYCRIRGQIDELYTMPPGFIITWLGIIPALAANIRIGNDTDFV